MYPKECHIRDTNIDERKIIKQISKKSGSEV
jgi:hypothetical protein